MESQDKIVSLLSLPRDLLIYILKKLPNFSLIDSLKQLCLVNRQLYKLVHDKPIAATFYTPIVARFATENWQANIRTWQCIQSEAAVRYFYTSWDDMCKDPVFKGLHSAQILGCYTVKFSLSDLCQLQKNFKVRRFGETSHSLCYVIKCGFSAQQIFSYLDLTGNEKIKEIKNPYYDINFLPANKKMPEPQEEEKKEKKNTFSRCAIL